MRAPARRTARWTCAPGSCMIVWQSMHTYLDAFRKFAELDGRTSRADFWGFVAWNSIFGVLATVADGFLFPHSRTGRGPLGLAYMAVMASPAWCAMVRRLHDKAISGWWTMLGLVPAVGQFILFRDAGSVGRQGGESVRTAPRHGVRPPAAIRSASREPPAPRHGGLRGGHAGRVPAR